MVFTRRVSTQPAPADGLASAATGPAGAVAGGRGEAGLVSGEAVELDVRVARVGSRAVALLLDILVEAVALLIVVPTVLVAVEAMLPFSDDALLQGITIVCFVLAVVGYPVFSETLSSGRTLGKLALGLRVVRDDGGPIRFRHALTRSLVSVALEWPGLILPLVTWVTSLGTMLANPRGKRLGDLAAGTIVIHERSPASWGWVPGMPPVLAGWATTLDLTGLGDDLALAVRHFLARGHGLAEPQRSRLGQALATEVAAATTPHPPPGVPGWAYLAAVLAERHRRAAHRLARARAVTARLWPELAVATPHPPQPGLTATSWGAPVRPAAPPAPQMPSDWPGHVWPTPPWRDATEAGREPDWTGLRPPPVASTLRPPAPSDRAGAPG